MKLSGKTRNYLLCMAEREEGIIRLVVLIRLAELRRGERIAGSRG